MEHGMALMVDKKRVIWDPVIGIYGNTAGNGSLIVE